jgi:cleavage stimulation factor subunit 1
VRTIHIHPSGDYLLVGTDHNIVRFYDLNTFQCFTSSNPQDHHFSPINQVRFSSDGKLFISAGKDGAVKLWDGVTGRCVNTLPNPHNGEVSFPIKWTNNNF